MRAMLPDAAAVCHARAEFVDICCLLILRHADAFTLPAPEAPEFFTEFTMLITSFRRCHTACPCDAFSYAAYAAITLFDVYAYCHAMMLFTLCRDDYDALIFSRHFAIAATILRFSSLIFFFTPPLFILLMSWRAFATYAIMPPLLPPAFYCRLRHALRYISLLIAYERQLFYYAMPTP